MTTHKHIYVPIEFAERYENLTSTNAQALLATEILEAKKLNIKAELDQLEDDALRFKAVCVTHKAALEDVYKEQEAKLNELIDSMWDVMPKAKENAKRAAAEIKPIADEVRELNKQLENLQDNMRHLNIWRAQEFITAVDQISKLSPATQELLTQVLKATKNENT